MFSIVLTQEEISYLLQELKLEPSSHSPLAGWQASKLTAAKKKKLQKALLDGGAYQAATADKPEHVHTLVVAALGIIARAESGLEILAISGDKQTRRSFFSYKHTWLGFQPHEDAYILTTPVDESIIRNFLFQHVTTHEKPAITEDIILSGDMLPVAAALFDLFRSAADKREFSVSSAEIFKQLSQAPKASATVFTGMYGELTTERLTACLDAMVKKRYIRLLGDRYGFEPAMRRLAFAMNADRVLQITRFDRTDKNPGMRVLTLIQGDKRLLVQQSVVAKLPVLVFRELDKHQAALLLTTIIFQPDSFVREYAKLFPAAKSAQQAEQPKSTETPSVVSAEPPKPVETKPAPQPEKPDMEPAAVPQPLAVVPVGGLACAACGMALPAGAKFCRGCGAKVETPAAKTCSSCGAVLPTGAKFCRSCGTEVKS